MDLSRHWLCEPPPGPQYVGGVEAVFTVRHVDEARARGYDVTGPFVPEPERGAVDPSEVERLRKALRHYQFGPRGWAARMALDGRDVGIDPAGPNEAAGGPWP